MQTECRLYPASPMPPTELIERLKGLASSLVSDVFGRWAGAPGLLPVSGLAPGQVIAGPAFTVRTRPGDNLVVHKALDIARPGEILVIAAGGATDRAILGGLMGQYAQTKDLAGIIVDGAVRDRSDLDRVSPPVFAAGISHLGPYKSGPGELRCPISVAGLTVLDGDIIIGDEDGIAVLPRARGEELITAAEAKGEAEAAESAAILAGNWDRTWIDEGLKIVNVQASSSN
ncbi:methyltransferase [Arthrobacter sp. EH-1B-1]|uniref:Putative 4-hydroxy-4-methyl-2-oxoglutarate aldolase n=1 Tax=Arthrobacter vasquezii TaxID=2977629 RepID=A0ABT6CUP4_9MICC|nr:methyltransferase [Arthrobacter vasquezii]MDF9277603.1 methyltransferase [Arthrobacter vasquezii]